MDMPRIEVEGCCTTFDTFSASPSNRENMTFTEARRHFTNSEG
jgi:hypothetical protein